MIGPDDRGLGSLGEPAPGEPTVDLAGGFLAPGQVLGDRYQVRMQLGRGGMGEVWGGPEREPPETTAPAGWAGAARELVESKRYKTA